jgi:mediator of RNA polymerase II transcription subunit 5
LYVSLNSFIPTLQPAPPFVDKLDIFRSETLVQFGLPEKKTQPADAAMNELLDSAVGFDSLVIPEIPISNTRAGLYICLNATVRKSLAHVLQPWRRLTLGTSLSLDRYWTTPGFSLT